MRGLLVVAMVAALAGCARIIWSKPGATQQDYATDSYACERDMRQSLYFGGGLVGQANAQSFMNRCMVAHGWTATRQQ